MTADPTSYPTAIQDMTMTHESLAVVRLVIVIAPPKEYITSKRLYDHSLLVSIVLSIAEEEVIGEEEVDGYQCWRLHGRIPGDLLGGRAKI